MQSTLRNKTYFSFKSFWCVYFFFIVIAIIYGGCELSNVEKCVKRLTYSMSGMLILRINICKMCQKRKVD